MDIVRSGIRPEANPPALPLVRRLGASPGAANDGAPDVDAKERNNRLAAIIGDTIQKLTREANANVDALAESQAEASRLREELERLQDESDRAAGEARRREESLRTRLGEVESERDKALQDASNYKGIAMTWQKRADQARELLMPASANRMTGEQS